MTADRISYANDLAHLAIERVCVYRPNAQKTRWLYEVLAAKGASILLQSEATLNYAEATPDRVQTYLDRQFHDALQWRGRIDVPRLIQWKWPFMLWYRDPPPEYGAAIYLLAEDLERIVGWIPLAAAARYPSYDAWIRSLLEDQRDQVDRLVRKGRIRHRG